jgi:hypothetical protein
VFNFRKLFRLILEAPHFLVFWVLHRIEVVKITDISEELAASFENGKVVFVDVYRNMMYYHEL